MSWREPGMRVIRAETAEEADRRWAAEDAVANTGFIVKSQVPGEKSLGDNHAPGPMLGTGAAADMEFMRRQAARISELETQLGSTRLQLVQAQREAERKRRPWLRIVIQRVTE